MLGAGCQTAQGEATHSDKWVRECRLETFVQEKGATKEEGEAISVYLGLVAAEEDLTVEQVMDQDGVPNTSATRPRASTRRSSGTRGRVRQEGQGPPITQTSTEWRIPRR